MIISLDLNLDQNELERCASFTMITSSAVRSPSVWVREMPALYLKWSIMSELTIKQGVGFNLVESPVMEFQRLGAFGLRS